MNQGNYLKTVYNEKARPLTSYPGIFAKELTKRFKLAPGTKLLDLGCGRGEFGRAFKEQGLIVEGADIETDTEFLPKDFPVKNFDFTTERFPYEDESFDVVFSKSTIEHAYEPKNFLEEQKRILKKGGRIIVMTPDWMTQINIFWNDYTHKRPFTTTGLKHALLAFDFKDVHTELFYQYPLYWKFPSLIIIAKILQLLGPVRKLHKNKLMRWSRELMILGTGTK